MKVLGGIVVAVGLLIILWAANGEAIAESTRNSLVWVGGLGALVGVGFLACAIRQEQRDKG